MPTSRNAEDVLEQIELIYQGVRKNAMQGFIKYKEYFDKKAIASKHKENEYVYVLQPKTDRHGSKGPFTEFRGIGPYNIK